MKKNLILAAGAVVFIGLVAWFVVPHKTAEVEVIVPSATSATVTTGIDGQATGLNVTVNPRQVVSDSRCPTGVQCIWAGTVTVRTALSTEVANGEHVMTLGQPQVFGDYDVTLTAVTPDKSAGQEIPVSSYRLTYEIKKH